MLHVRTMFSNDIESVYRLGKRTREFDVSSSVSFYEKDDLYQIIHNHTTINTVAYLGRHLAGFLMAQQMTKSWVQLNNIVVRPRFQGRGISKVLLDEFSEELKAREVKYVSAIVSKDAKSTREFWKYQGFNEGKEFVFIEKMLD